MIKDNVLFYSPPVYFTLTMYMTGVTSSWWPSEDGPQNTQKAEKWTYTTSFTNCLFYCSDQWMDYSNYGLIRSLSINLPWFKMAFTVIIPLFLMSNLYFLKESAKPNYIFIKYKVVVNLYDLWHLCCNPSYSISQYSPACPWIHSGALVCAKSPPPVNCLIVSTSAGL